MTKSKNMDIKSGLPVSDKGITQAAEVYHLLLELPMSSKKATVHFFVSSYVSTKLLDDKKQKHLVIEDRAAVPAVMGPDPNDKTKQIVITPAVTAKNDFTSLESAMKAGTVDTFITLFIQANYTE